MSFLANQFENLQFCQKPNQKGGGPNKTHPANFVAPLARQGTATGTLKAARKEQRPSTGTESPDAGTGRFLRRH